MPDRAKYIQIGDDLRLPVACHHSFPLARTNHCLQVFLGHTSIPPITFNASEMRSKHSSFIFVPLTASWRSSSP